MRKLAGILSIATAMALLTGIVLAQGVVERGDDDEEARLRPAGGRFMAVGLRGLMMGRGRMMRGERPALARGRAGVPGQAVMLLRLADEIDLTEAQRDKISEILTDQRKKAIAKNAEREIAEVELRKLMMEDDPDLDAIEVQIRKIADLQAQIRFSKVKVGLDVKNVLTDEQKAALKKLAKERRAKAVPEDKDTDRPGRGPRGRARRGR